MSSNEETINEFIGLTMSSESIAKQYLENHNWDLQEAVESYFMEPEASSSSAHSAAAAAGGSSSTSTNSAAQSNKKQKSSAASSKFKSFSDIRENDDDDDEENNLFTGGEKSGLQVENPDDVKRRNDPLGLVQDLLKKAERQANEPDTREPVQEVKNSFIGAGHKLGSVENEVDSVQIGDSASKKKTPQRVNRTITFWKEGFQVDEGQLYRYDDPKNAEYLKILNSGRAPLALLNVEMFQEVDVQVIKKMDEEFKPPKRKFGGFVGKGQRLGSPVPGEPLSASTEIEQQTEEPSNVESETKEEATPAEEEPTGDAPVQIRLSNGKRIVHKFNSTDSVEVVFDFVKQNTEDSGRSWFLAFAFPLKKIEDTTQTIKEAGLINSVVVQRWS
ncbi:hypothetical protein B5S28_g2736 [[Candida] boidinii]|uniref:Unnamed protein product n=1 Tax=Candida boidinii TaxID=5477 RepID=A0ACB5TEL6_CANBO|nr:hypothetical protein B5S28_g2736 [[Candida] boidinii]OWB71698.1 hypothetical protein B5S31_g1389 [[Candida] boidinii]OWB76427.1 hypothetical protein B5S32_g578 [[Candida] boidinii]GME87113.1 unnamed protein product [[Candida] boidinii]